MILLDAPPCACLLDEDTVQGPGLHRAANEMSPSITLSNGNTVDLVGTSPGMTWPPNYLEDLRAGRL